MHLKNVLHIKMQFVSRDFMVFKDSFQKAQWKWTQQVSLCHLVVL